MIKTLIIDDEPLARQLIQEYLEEFPEFDVVKECQDGFEGMKAIQEIGPDLIFLDVQMPKINGLEMLELLENPPPVIFTTAFDEFAVKAFDSHAIDYLLKPFSKLRFSQAISKFRQMGRKKAGVQEILNGISSHGMNPNRVVVKVRNEIKILPFEDIKYFEANDDYVNIFTSEGKFLKNKTLRFFESVLDPQIFVRVHRSYIVKVEVINKIEPYEKDGFLIKLKTGEAIPVSKSGLPKLKAVLGF